MSHESVLKIPNLSRRKWLLPFSALALLIALSASAQKGGSEFSGITERGRLLAEYDKAAWHSTDAVQALNPDRSSLSRYVAQKTAGRWTVAYGRFSSDGQTFLIVYEAIQGATPEQFTVKKQDPPLEDRGFYFHAAKAIELAIHDFHGENRPYNISVLPAPSEELYVYIVPGQTQSGVYPMGGDARYLISADGSKIIEKRQLHSTVMEAGPGTSASASSDLAGHTHSHDLSDVPEDTDVFYVLSRTPRFPEYISAGNHVFMVRTDGTITRVK